MGAHPFPFSFPLVGFFLFLKTWLDKGMECLSILKKLVFKGVAFFEHIHQILILAFLPFNINCMEIFFFCHFIFFCCTFLYSEIKFKSAFLHETKIVDPKPWGLNHGGSGTYNKRINLKTF